MSMSKEEILVKANRLISKTRNETHGDAFKNHAEIEDKQYRITIEHTHRGKDRTVRNSHLRKMLKTSNQVVFANSLEKSRRRRS